MSILIIKKPDKERKTAKTTKAAFNFGENRF